MTSKQRIAQAERTVKAQTKGGGKMYVIHGDGDNFMTSDGVKLSLAEFERIRGDNVKVVRLGIDLDRL